MKLDYGEFISLIGYHQSILANHLKFDNWDILNGLLLLAGLSPEKTTVSTNKYTYDKNSIVNNFSSFRRHSYNDLPEFYLIYLQPLDADRLFFITQDVYYNHYDRSYSGTAKSLSISTGKEINRDQVADAMRKIYIVQKFYEKKLQDFIGIWFSGDHWDREEDYFPVKDYIELAEKKKIDVPWFDWAKKEGLINIGKHLGPRTDIEFLFLNENHVFHSPELKIAVEAWIELYENNPPQGVPKGGHKKYINDWLEQKFPELGVRAKDRIATIINPNPKGGASPII